LITLAAGLGGLAGGCAGWGATALLAVIPRGASLPARWLVPTGAVITGAGAAITVGTPRIGLAVWLGVMLLTLGAIDLACHRLPDALTLPAIPITVAVAGITQLVAPGSGSLPRALGAGVAVFALFAVLSLISSRAMGRGDVKLVPSLGIAVGFLSWPALVVAMTAAFVIGSMVAVVGILARRMTAASRFAFGPYLILGSWLMVLAPSVAG
jgi:leader peptidase (prepilin peptidase)/N-methyltransferase